MSLRHTTITTVSQVISLFCTIATGFSNGKIAIPNQQPRLYNQLPARHGNKYSFARGNEEDAIREDGDRPAGAELISCSPIEQHRSIMLLKLPN